MVYSIIIHYTTGCLPAHPKQGLLKGIYNYFTGFMYNKQLVSSFVGVFNKLPGHVIMMEWASHSGSVLHMPYCLEQRIPGISRQVTKKLRSETSILSNMDNTTGLVGPMVRLGSNGFGDQWIWGWRMCCILKYTSSFWLQNPLWKTSKAHTVNVYFLRNQTNPDLVEDYSPPQLI